MYIYIYIIKKKYLWRTLHNSIGNERSVIKTLRAHVESNKVYNAFKHVSIFWVDSEIRGLHKASIHIPKIFNKY